MKKVILADPQELTSRTIESIVNKLDGLTIQAVMQEGESVVSLVKAYQPDLLITDYNVSKQVSRQDLKLVCSISSDTKVMVVSGDENRSSILGVISLGVKSFLTKECSEEEIVKAIRSTIKGERFYCNRIFEVLHAKHAKESVDFESPVVLSRREQDVLRHIAQGKTSKEIAEALFISLHTVNSHRKNIIKKLDIKSPTEFVMFALEMGLT